METIFDWLSVLLFCGLAVLYLQRSATEEPQDKIWHYLPPALGCAVANYLGNHGYEIAAIAMLVAAAAFIHYILKPWTAR